MILNPPRDSALKNTILSLSTSRLVFISLLLCEEVRQQAWVREVILFHILVLYIRIYSVQYIYRIIFESAIKPPIIQDGG